MRNLPSAIIVATTLAVAFGCSKKAEREWSASDHDHPEEPAPAAQPNTPQPPPPAAAGASLADSVWTTTCAPCHGATGKGDGPAGRSLRIPDLSTASWQRLNSDEQVARVINEGRGNMPAFQFPPDKTNALVQKVRSLSSQ